MQGKNRVLFEVFLKNPLRRNSMIVMMCTGLSRMLGIVRSRVLAIAYGAGVDADALNFSYGLPNNLRKIVADTAWHQTVQPAFSGCMTNSKEDTLNQVQGLLSKLQALQCLLFIPLVFISWFFRIPVIKFTSDFANQDSTILASNLLIWFTLFVSLIGFNSLYSALLHAHGCFVSASLAPLASSLAVIFCVVLLSTDYGVYAMAFGTVAGGLLQTLWTWLSLKRFGYRFRLDFNFTDPVFRVTIKSWMNVSFLAGINMIVQQYAFYLASGMTSGALTAVSYAIVIYQAPYGMFAQGLSTATAPSITAAKTLGDMNGLSLLVSNSIKLIVMLLLPTTLLLSFLGREIAAVLLQGGAFTQGDTHLTAQVLGWYAVGMVPMGIYSYISRFFIATNDSKTPLIVGCIASLVDVVVMTGLARTGFGPASLGVGTLAAALTASVILYRKVTMFFPSGTMSNIPKCLMKVTFFNIPLVIVLFAYKQLTPPWYEQGLSLKSVAILAMIGVSSILIIASLYYISGLMRLDRNVPVRKQSYLHRPN